MIYLAPIHRPVDTTLLECIGVGYVDKEVKKLIVYKGKFTQQLFFKELGAHPDKEEWFALCKKDD